MRRHYEYFDIDPPDIPPADRLDFFLAGLAAGIPFGVGVTMFFVWYG